MRALGCRLNESRAAMGGLILLAKELALARADQYIQSMGGQRWYEREWWQKNWDLCSRKHAEIFPNCPTAQYYHIIDRISKGEAP